LAIALKVFSIKLVDAPLFISTVTELTLKVMWEDDVVVACSDFTKSAGIFKGTNC